MKLPRFLLADADRQRTFSRRCTGKFSEDGKTIAGRREIAEDAKTWRTDFDLTYTKVE